MSSQFFAMGGYASYVWSSFGIALAIYAWNVLAPLTQRKALLKSLVEDTQSQEQQ